MGARLPALQEELISITALEILITAPETVIARENCPCSLWNLSLAEEHSHIPLCHVAHGTANQSCCSSPWPCRQSQWQDGCSGCGCSGYMTGNCWGSPFPCSGRPEEGSLMLGHPGCAFCAELEGLCGGRCPRGSFAGGRIVSEFGLNQLTGIGWGDEEKFEKIQNIHLIL